MCKFLVPIRPVLPKWDPFNDVEEYALASREATAKFILSKGYD